MKRRHWRTGQGGPKPLVQRAPLSASSMFDKPPPQALEAEMGLLGSMILDGRIVPEVMRLVRERHFYSEAHSVIFRCIEAVWRKNQGNVDLILMVDQLRSNVTGERTELDLVGGVEYLEALANSVPTALGWQHYAKVVSEKARMRKAIDIGGELVHQLYLSGDAGDANEAIVGALDSLAKIARGSVGREPAYLGATADALIQSLQEGHRETIPTGVAAIDGLCDGLPQQGVVAVFGYPSGGKSTLTLTVALSLAMGSDVREPLPVRVCSFEQGPRRVTATLLSAWSGVRVHTHMNRGTVPTTEEMERMAESAAGFNEVDFAMYEDNLDPPTLFAEISAVAARKPRGVLVVDYVQDIPPFGEFTEATPRIGEAMRILARIARELGWLVLVVSQLDKAAGKANRRPKMSDGLGSSAIEQRSDLMLFVWRPHQHDSMPQVDDTLQQERARNVWNARRGRTVIGVIKNKYGTIGSREMMFDGSVMRFREATEEEKRTWPELDRE